MIEAVAAGLAGAALGGAAGSLVGLTIPGALIGAANGVRAGHRRIYAWTTVRGVAAFTLDSTWALATTTAGVVAQTIGGRDPGFDTRLSERQNRFVYARGFRPRRGFAITLGNVVCGAGDTTQARRARLVTDHEDVHVWQARLLGPVYPVLYVGWTVGAGALGAAAWGVRHRHRPFGAVVESYAYYANPFEWWAYSRDAHWPPTRKVPEVGWRRPAVRSFAARRGDLDGVDRGPVSSGPGTTTAPR